VREAQVRSWWVLRGRPHPPPHAVKVTALRRYAKRYGLNTFVETGTYVGTTLADVTDQFRRLVSIELSEELYERARERFAAEPKVTLLRGDSTEQLPGVVTGLGEPALFWLDAHYSEGNTARSAVDTPIRAELEAILGSSPHRHVVLIDDAHEFIGLGDYPSIDELATLVAKTAPSYTVAVRDNIIRLIPG
jgi:hypothetical protein